MTCIIVRCANGVVVWVRQATSSRDYDWVCTRDGFKLAPPATTAGLETFLVQLASHSQSLSGAINQLVELTV